jgi:hypothetical protein
LNLPPVGKNAHCHLPKERRDSGFAKTDAQFFKMIGGMPSGPEPLSTSKCKTLQNALDFI